MMHNYKLFSFNICDITAGQHGDAVVSAVALQQEGSSL